MKHSAWLLMFLTITTVCMAETLEFVFSDFPPFECIENGFPAGINKEIIEEACRRLDITPVFRQLPWKRALLYAKEGKADAVFSLFINDERIRYYSFPEENINTVRMVLITDRESTIEINKLEDLKGKKTGVYLGSSYGDKFDRADWIIKEPAHTNDSLLRKQDAGRTDVAVIDERVAEYWCRKIGMEDRFRILRFIVTENPTYVAFSKAKGEKNGKNLADRFSVVFKEMKNEHFIEKINKKYMFGKSRKFGKE